MELKRASMIARDLMNFHGLKYSWEFDFDNAVRRFGACNRERKVISLSAPLTELNDETHVINTILHEIAHALAPDREWHGPNWRTIAKSIGCDGNRCYGREVMAPAHKWIGTCPACLRTVKRHKRGQLACAFCCKGKFNADYLFTWTEGGTK